MDRNVGFVRMNRRTRRAMAPWMKIGKLFLGGGCLGKAA